MKICYYKYALKKAYAGIAQLIERCLAKAEVAGLSPVSRSIFFIKLNIYGALAKLLRSFEL
jgi:predicted MarR family transcription regulator